jgi:hypothetical protein
MEYLKTLLPVDRIPYFYFHNSFSALLIQALCKPSLCSMNDYQMGGYGGSELGVLGEWEVIRTGKLATTNELS